MDASETIENYVAAWNERDADRRTALLEAVFSDAGSYTDAVIAHIGGFQERIPNAAMELRSRVDGYDDVVRFAWAVVVDGQDVIVGTDFVTLGSDGRIGSVTGFFGEL